MKKIGFIGSGNMGGAIIAAACKSINPSEVVITNKTIAKAEKLASELGCNVAKSNIEVAETSEYVVLGVKPHILPGVVREIAPALKKAIDEGREIVLVTMAAGVAIASIKEYLADASAVPVIRIMPNMPALIGEGMILIAKSDENPCDVPEEKMEELQKIIAAAGAFERINEAQMDICTSVASCSPAFTYMFIEAMADGAVQVGVPRAMAMRLAANAVKGSATMVLETGMHPGALKDAVCSPGGSTIVGVTTLEQYGMRNAAAQAIIKSTEKNLKLGK